MERIELFHLHRIDPKVPLADQVGELQADGKIRHIGLSEVSVAEIQAARAITPIATVQNLYNLADRGAEPALDYCERERIGFIPWFPMATGRLARPGGSLQRIADEPAVTPRTARARVAATAIPRWAADPRYFGRGSPGRKRA